MNNILDEIWSSTWNNVRDRSRSLARDRVSGQVWYNVWVSFKGNIGYIHWYTIKHETKKRVNKDI